jgi:hypothetical protein
MNDNEGEEQQPRKPKSNARCTRTKRRLSSVEKDNRGESKRARIAAGRMAEKLRLEGESRATAIVAEATGLSRRQVQYAQQCLQKGEEGKKNGGFRWEKFDPIEKAIFHTYLENMVNEAPKDRVQDYAAALREELPELPKFSNDDVKHVFQSWGWTWKLPARIQIRKYTFENMRRYGNWVAWFRSVDWSKVCSLVSSSSFLLLTLL